MAKGYYHTRESVEEYIRMAEDVSGVRLIEKLKLFLPVSATLLELGSGPGTDWNLLKADFEVVGSDNSQEFLNHLVSSNPEGRFLELDAITLNTEQRFDGIYSNKVLHHLKEHELSDSIKRQHAVLNENGVICHSFWKGEGSEVFKGLFVKYHTEQTLKALFEPYFELCLLESYAEFEEGDSLILIGKKTEQ